MNKHINANVVLVVIPELKNISQIKKESIEGDISNCKGCNSNPQLMLFKQIFSERTIL
jgi:hypothetical protein